jgi:hypothetical protein
MAAVISNEPRRIVLSIIDLPKRLTKAWQKYAKPTTSASSAKSRLNSISAFFIAGGFPQMPNTGVAP